MIFCSIYHKCCFSLENHRDVQMLMGYRTITATGRKNCIAKLKWLVLGEDIHL